jgi:hypothetical protein
MCFCNVVRFILAYHPLAVPVVVVGVHQRMSYAE